MALIQEARKIIQRKAKVKIKILPRILIENLKKQMIQRDHIKISQVKGKAPIKSMKTKRVKDQVKCTTNIKI